MIAHLPLARGNVNARVDLRPRIDPAGILTSAPGAVPEALAGVTFSVFVIDRRGRLLLGAPPAHGEGVSLARPEGRLWSGLLAEDRLALAMGVTGDGIFHIGLVADERAHEDALWPGHWMDLRRAGHLLGDDEAALATSATALAAWHGQALHCSRCGGLMRPGDAGWTRRCTACDLVEYPRQDPAVIMAVMDEEDRILLAHNVHWRPRFWSLVAGFVDAGETPERAVIREIHEEVGLEVIRPQYVASQPWPFPRSVMMAFTAHLDAASPRLPTPDGMEIEAARFFTREELRAAVASGDIEPPGPAAIARFMIEDWLGGPLPPSPLRDDFGRAPHLGSRF